MLCVSVRLQEPPWVMAPGEALVSDFFGAEALFSKSGNLPAFRMTEVVSSSRWQRGNSSFVLIIHLSPSSAEDSRRCRPSGQVSSRFWLSFRRQADIINGPPEYRRCRSKRFENQRRK